MLVRIIRKFQLREFEFSRFDCSPAGFNVSGSTDNDKFVTISVNLSFMLLCLVVCLFRTCFSFAVKPPCRTLWHRSLSIPFYT